MISLLLITLLGARAETVADLAQVWHERCHQLLRSPPLGRTMFNSAAERAALDYIKRVSPVADEELGHRHYAYALTAPVPSRALVECVAKGECVLRTDLNTAHREGAASDASDTPSPDLHGIVVQLRSGLDALSAAELDLNWAKAFPNATIERQGVTHVGRGVSEWIFLNRAVLVTTREGLLMRIELSEMTRFVGDGALDFDGRFRSVNRAELLVARPKRDQLITAARTFIALTSPSLAQLELSVGKTESGYIVGFKRNPVLGTELLPVAIDPVGPDRWAIGYYKMLND